MPSAPRCLKPGLGEALERLLHRERPRLQRRMRELAEAVVGGPHALVVAAEVLLDHQVPVGGVVDADADVLVVEDRLRLVDPQRPAPARGVVVGRVLGDVAVGDQRIAVGQLVVPVLRLTDAHGVELALLERLERLGLVADDGEVDAVEVVAVLVELLVARPPVVVARERDRAALVEVLRVDHVGAGGRRELPLVALDEVGPEVLVEVPRDRRQVEHLLVHVGLGLVELHREGVVVVARDAGEGAVVEVVATRAR